jgi:hypothetical protein
VSEHDLDKLPGIKERELREIGACAVCGEKLLAGPNAHPLFYRVTVETCGVLLDNVRRHSAFAEFIGNGAIAMVMGADHDMAKIISTSPKRLVHVGCASSESVIDLVRCSDEAES